MKEGDIVSHNIYGQGIVVEYIDKKQVYVRFENQSDEDVFDYDESELTLIKSSDHKDWVNTKKQIPHKR